MESVSAGFIYFLGICQLVLMDADTSHLNVGGVFLRKQTINS